MTAESQFDNYKIPIREFVASKQATFFQTLKQPRFTGQLILRGSKGKEWTFYLCLGRLVYATGGVHPVRRWRRNLAAYMPEMVNELGALDKILAPMCASGFKICWEYDLLSLWLEQQKVTREQLAQMVRAVIVEIFFDVTQAGQITFELKVDKTPPTQLTLIDADQVIVESSKEWQSWQSAKLADRSPNSAPIIRQKEQLQSHAAPQTYEAMLKLFDGKYSLRDIAVQTKRDFIQVTRLTMPYVQWGFLELIDIPDLPTPLSGLVGNQSSDPQPLGLIACVDDSFTTCESLQKISNDIGYDFIPLNNALDALSTLLARKPDLIFLELNMPNSNGYEICSQLRKISFFYDIPIIILTENLGVLDRMRAKMSGCTDFLLKPVDRSTTLTLISKYLKQPTAK